MKAKNKDIDDKTLLYIAQLTGIEGGEEEQLHQFLQQAQSFEIRQLLHAIEKEEILRVQAEVKMSILKCGIQAEITVTKSLSKLGILNEEIIPHLKFLTQDQLKDKLETNLAYIRGHIEDSNSDICDQLGLLILLGESSG